MLSPAKLNLSLRILGKRPDGFHEIDSFMVKLPGLADEITIEPADTFSFTCSDSTLPTDGRNLVVKAAQAFSQKFEKSDQAMPFHIHLEKVIPHGAGLGGGSSNAAITLLALNDRLESPLSPETLHELAASLGSDIPFFLYEGAARCTGRGEIIVPAESPPPYKVVLFKPQFSVPTPDAYRKCLDADSVPGINYEPQTHESLTLVNDLEKPVFAKHRYLAELKHWLSNRRDTQAVLMSGSGSTIFAILHRRAKPIVLINSAHRHFDENLWTWSGTL
ncbi:MAG: 4-(cytidine 5'-diphospho)-2-C-methyl-D-erythritol kinase [Verrucomicrobia bacterium]|jgi:4-diphosphocytidyl-2-C-methyl-D-erythritol kinase|nr:4-(cytidine 5'-diphospho)-2-C-methyl-D-erythritol kinase [Verrucomicrobiota bacterium]|tara:strand:+ start:11445 stop:12272 length:828 start_codon:yes stop_codon:yes gene_type:complete